MDRVQRLKKIRAAEAKLVGATPRQAARLAKRIVREKGELFDE